MKKKIILAFERLKNKSKIFFVSIFLVPGVHSIKAKAQTDSIKASVEYKNGITFLKTGDLTNAVSSFKEAVKFNPQLKDAYKILIYIYTKSNKLDSAKIIGRQLIVIDTSDFHSQIVYAGICAASNQPDSVMYCIKRVYLQHPDEVEANFQFANANLVSKNYEEALPPFLKCEQIYKKTNNHFLGETQYYIAICYMNIDHIKKTSENRGKIIEYLKQAQVNGYTIPSDIRKSFDIE